MKTDEDEIRALELLAFEMGRKDLAPSVQLLPHERGRRVLASYTPTY